MRCHDFERLILDGEERPLTENERRALNGHLERCPDCRAFEAGRAALRQALKDLPAAGLPESLDVGTHRACLEELAAERAGIAAGRAARVPWPVVAASALAAILAAVWLTATLPDIKLGDALPWTAWLAVAFMAQSVFVLFLSPVLLRTARRPDAEDARTL